MLHTWKYSPNILTRKICLFSLSWSEMAWWHAWAHVEPYSYDASLNSKLSLNQSTIFSQKYVIYINLTTLTRMLIQSHGMRTALSQSSFIFSADRSRMRIKNRHEFGCFWTFDRFFCWVRLTLINLIDFSLCFFYMDSENYEWFKRTITV